MEMLRTLASLFFCVYFVHSSPFESSIGARMEITENEVKTVTFNFTETDRPVKIIVRSSDTFIFSVIEGSRHNITNGESGNFTAYIRGEFLGRAEVHVFVNKLFKGTQLSNAIQGASDNESWYITENPVDVVVKRAESPLSTVFTSIVIVLVCLANIAMGCKTDLKEVKRTLKRPVAPITGLVSQFTLMPLVGTMQSPK
uniref:Uncharacterized protein n=1 Tax=Magallana gigas TaxID=29159 RepID=A0A8W8JT58_MAGGI